MHCSVLAEGLWKPTLVLSNHDCRVSTGDLRKINLDKATSRVSVPPPAVTTSFDRRGRDPHLQKGQTPGPTDQSNHQPGASLPHGQGSNANRHPTAQELQDTPRPRGGSTQPTKKDIILYSVSSPIAFPTAARSLAGSHFHLITPRSPLDLLAQSPIRRLGTASSLSRRFSFIFIFHCPQRPSPSHLCTEALSYSLPTNLLAGREPGEADREWGSPLSSMEFASGRRSIRRPRPRLTMETRRELRSPCRPPPPAP